MKHWEKKIIGRLSVRGFMLVFRVKNKSQLQNSYGVVVAGCSQGFELGKCQL